MRRPGLVDMARLVDMAGLVDMARLMDMAGLMGLAGLMSGARLGAMAGSSLADMAAGTRTRLLISHDIQDAWINRLRHLDNSHPCASAKYPQPGQAVASSSLSRWRTRW